VIKEMGGETKKGYSLLLLSLATNRRIISGGPLAFGEGDVKQRIKNVLNFRKPPRVIIIAAVALVAVLSIGFAVSKADDITEYANTDSLETENTDTTEYTNTDSLETENNGATEYTNTGSLSSATLVWPYRGDGISSSFGQRPGGFHIGLDIQGSEGDAVVAAEAGEVILAECYEKNKDYGNLVIIEHSGGTQTWYSHLSAFAVSKGDKVEQGQIIGEVGNTGRTTGPHLHFEVRVNDEPLDPLLYLK
jgi:murein DD-endopeptidase MepM/ murein hydrolase activator NlpD